MSRIVTTESMKERFSGLLATAALKQSRPRSTRARTQESALVIADIRRAGELLEVLRDLREKRVHISGVLVLRAKSESGLAQLIDAISTEAKKRIHTFDSTKIAELKRVAQAHLLGAQNETIAAVRVVGNELWVTGCNLELYRVPKDKISALAKLSRDQLANFKINDTGSWIHWEDGDVDLTLQDIRYVVDDKYRQHVDKQNRAAMQSYGKAIRKLRKSKGLTQCEVAEKAKLSERQVRRLENGEVQPHSSTLEKLAAAHGMKLNAYLLALAEYDE